MSFVFDRQTYERRTAWFTQARFGLFLHWGLYAIPARGEWVRSVERIPSGDYDPLMAELTPATAMYSLTVAVTCRSAMNGWQIGRAHV